jgi:hypothetical protein
MISPQFIIWRDGRKCYLLRPQFIEFDALGAEMDYGDAAAVSMGGPFHLALRAPDESTTRRCSKDKCQGPALRRARHRVGHIFHFGTNIRSPWAP